MTHLILLKFIQSSRTNKKLQSSIKHVVSCSVTYGMLSLECKGCLRVDGRETIGGWPPIIPRVLSPLDESEPVQWDAS